MRRSMTKPIDAHRAKVLKLIEDADLNLVQVAKAIGRNRAYMQQYIARAVPEELHEQDRKALAKLVNVPEDELREPNARKSGSLTIRKPAIPMMDYRQPVAEKGPRNLPIRGRARGASGVIINLDQSPVAWAERPASLMGAVDAFAVYVAGDSMSPALPNGALVYVDPAKPPRNGDFVVIEKANGEAIVKILKSQNGETITLAQINPPEDKIKVSRADIVSIFKIVTVDFP